MDLVIEKPIDELLNRIPLDAKKEVLKFLAKEEVDGEHFMDRLGTYSSIEELQANYHLEMEDTFSRDVFIIQVRFLGVLNNFQSSNVKDNFVKVCFIRYEFIIR